MRDHMSFEQSSRAVYISCNSPSTLQDIDFSAEWDNTDYNRSRYPCIPHKKYRFAKRVQVGFGMEHDAVIPTVQFVAVKRLVLEYVYMADINYLLTHTCIPFTNVTHLELFLGLDIHE
eukprot:513890_1